MIDIFKIDDIKDTDPLKNEKINAINFLKTKLERNLTKNPPTALHPSHLYWIIEERKGFLAHLFKENPDLADPAKKPDVKIKHIKGWGVFKDSHYKIVRQQYQIFFTDKLDGNNWREKIMEAENPEKIKEIKDLIGEEIFKIQGWTLIPMMEKLKLVRKEIKYLKEGITSGLYEKMKKEAQKSALIRDIGWVDRHIYFSGRGTRTFLIYDLLKKEIEEVLRLAQTECKKLGINYKWKEYAGATPKPNEILEPDTSKGSDTDSSENSDTDPKKYSDTDSEAEKPTPQETKKKLEEVKKELAKNPEDKPLNPVEIRKKLVELQTEADNSDDKDALQKEIAELRKLVEDLKKSLKEILQNAKDYAQKLFNYFQKENIKQITFEDDGTAKVEYENNENSKTFSSQEVDNHQELKELKEQIQKSEQKSLSRQELSQIVGSISSPTSTEKGHWEKFKYLYLSVVGIGLLIIGGLIVYWWMKKEKDQNQIE